MRVRNKFNLDADEMKTQGLINLKHNHCCQFKRFMQCAVERHGYSAGSTPARQLSLQPVAIEAVVEVTKRLKPSV
jgi:hypothetical protein